MNIDAKGLFGNFFPPVRFHLVGVKNDPPGTIRWKSPGGAKLDQVEAARSARQVKLHQVKRLGS